VVLLQRVVLGDGLLVLHALLLLPVKGLLLLLLLLQEGLDVGPLVRELAATEPELLEAPAVLFGAICQESVCGRWRKLCFFLLFILKSRIFLVCYFLSFLFFSFLFLFRVPLGVSMLKQPR